MINWNCVFSFLGCGLNPLGLPVVGDVDDHPKQPNSKNGKDKHDRNNDQLVVLQLMRDSAIE